MKFNHETGGKYMYKFFTSCIKFNVHNIITVIFIVIIWFNQDNNKESFLICYQCYYGT